MVGLWRLRVRSGSQRFLTRSRSSPRCCTEPEQAQFVQWKRYASAVVVLDMRFTQFVSQLGKRGGFIVRLAKHNAQFVHWRYLAQGFLALFGNIDRMTRHGCIHLDRLER